MQLGRAKVGMVVLLVLIVTGYFLISGFPNPYGSINQTYDNPSDISGNSGAKKSIQIGALKFGAPEAIGNQPTIPINSPIPTQPISPSITIIHTTPIPTSTPVPTPTPSVLGCHKYEDLPIPPACYCDENSICHFRSAKQFCQSFGCQLTTDCHMHYAPDCSDGSCAYRSPWTIAQCTQFMVNGECDTVRCIAKPVIYLYPEKPTFVDVLVVTTGKIVVSYPLYPLGGWKNVFAYPDGKLFYQNNWYNELFYESEVKDIQKPASGIIIKREELKREFESILTQLGLIKPERDEFIDFWVPRLNNTNAPYILFSLIDDQEKNRVDHIDVSPKPQTLIELIAYFKPLQEKLDLPALSLPNKIPERKGFTVVEWGGTLDK